MFKLLVTCTIFHLVLSAYKLKTIIQHERITSKCPSKGCITSCKDYHINRTTKTFDLNLTFLDDMTDCQVNVIAYVLLSNEYRRSPIQFSNACNQVVQYKVFDLVNLFHDHTNPPMPPLVANVHYRINGWTANSDKYPFKFPVGRYKVDIPVSHSRTNKTVLMVVWYFTAAELSVKV